MLTRRIIPCLDVRDGRIVKGVRFADLRDVGTPADRAAEYEAQGADEIVLLDVSATIETRSTALDTVRAVRAALSIPPTVGGGVRSADDAIRLLETGADRVAVNSAAVGRPGLIAELSRHAGQQCIVLSIDAAREGAGWRAVVRSGRDATELDAIEWAVRGAALGAGEILLTSFDRDGTRDGYDLGLIAATASAVDVPIIASGGAAHETHMAAALDAGASAVLAASIFHDDDRTVADVKQSLEQSGFPVRPC